MRIHKFILPGLALVCAIIGGFLFGVWLLARHPLASTTPSAPTTSSPTPPSIPSSPPGMTTENDPDPYRIETPVAEAINEYATWVLTSLGENYQSWLLNSSTSQVTILRGLDVMQGIRFATTSRDGVFAITFRAYGPESSTDYFDETTAQHMLTETRAQWDQIITLEGGKKKLVVSLDTDCDDSHEILDSKPGKAAGFRVNNRLVSFAEPRPITCTRNDMFGSTDVTPFSLSFPDKQTQTMRVTLPWDERGGQWSALEIAIDKLSEQSVKLLESK